MAEQRRFNEGDFVSVQVVLTPFNKIRCQAKIIRKGNNAGKYPNGMGLQFFGLSKIMQRELEVFLSSRKPEPSQLAA